MKRTRIVNSRRFTAFLVLFTLSLTLSIVLIHGLLTGEQAFGMSERESARTVVVQEGDTLWTIAAPIAERDGGDVRSIIHQIKRLNRLEDSTIYPGQPLILPGV